jgi:threonyl-tRNA synthetase
MVCVQPDYTLLLLWVIGCRPFWLSPRQAIVIPVTPEVEEYAKTVHTSISSPQRDKDTNDKQVVSTLVREGYYVEMSDSKATLQKRIREAQLEQFNYILVVGKQEVVTGNVES